MNSYSRIAKFVTGVCSLLVSYFVACYIRFGGYRGGIFLRAANREIFAYLLISYVLAFLLQPDRKTSYMRRRNILKDLAEVLLLNGSMALAYFGILYLSQKAIYISRIFSGVFFLTNIVLMYAGFRIIWAAEKRYVLSHKRRSVVFTSRENALEVLHNLIHYGEESIQMDAVILVSDNTMDLFRIEYDDKGHSCFATSDQDYETYLRQGIVDLALVGLSDRHQELNRTIIRQLDNMGIVSLVSYSGFSFAEDESRMVQFGRLNAVEYAPRLFTQRELIEKRVLDLIGGAVGCLLCCMLAIFIAPAIWLEDRGPVIFRQQRVGKNGRYFYMYKFRSMRPDADQVKEALAQSNEMEGPIFKIRDDPRITKVGKFIRKTSIDEFPQFFNVLKGEMSLVGTRPPTVEEFKKYSNHHKRRLSLKPGITGLWQVHGRSSVTDFEEIVRLDCYYIDHWSIWLDIRILLQTVWTVLMQKGSV